MKFQDLTGISFENYDVIKRIEDYIFPNGTKAPQYLCHCKLCNTSFTALGCNIKRGYTKSCGCDKGRRISKALKKYNTYNLSNEYGIGYTSNTNKEFYFDLEDYDKIKDYCWNENGGHYIFTRKNNKTIGLHRLIMDCPSDMVVDHINHNKIDNRKANLRIVTQSQNAMNTIRGCNTSGYRGVSWNTQKNKWVAQISVNKKHIFLGYYNDIDEAVLAYKQARNKYYGDI